MASLCVALILLRTTLALICSSQSICISISIYLSIHPSIQLYACLDIHMYACRSMFYIVCSPKIWDMHARCIL